MVGPRPLGGRCVLLGWGGVGWGMKLTFMGTCTWRKCYAVAVEHVFKGGGWGGVGWDNNGSATHTSWIIMVRYCTLCWTSMRTSRHATGRCLGLLHTCYATCRCLALPHIRHATLCSLGFPHIPLATLFYILWDFHTYVMLPNWTLS